MTKTWFIMDERLGIPLPKMAREWSEYTPTERQEMLQEWERIRARIPDRIRELEEMINRTQQHASQEEDWERVCADYDTIYHLASVINDLNIWMRVDPDFHINDEV